MSNKGRLSKNQKGGYNELQNINFWAQDQVPPSSYKIQLGYIEIPKNIQFEEKWLDTPYRFRSLHDANDEADRIFEGYTYRIVGSNDNPYWDAPSYLHQNRSLSDDKQDFKWYDVVGLKPIDENPYSQYSPVGQPPKLDPKRQYSMQQLSKLKTPLQAERQMVLESQK